MMFKKPLLLISYSLSIVIVSALITTCYFHFFVLGNNHAPTAANEEQALTIVPNSQVEKNPIKDNNGIVEIFSYGCHFCAKNEKNVSALEARLPAGSKIIRIHLSNSQNTGLASFAPVFATLTVMGIEPQYRESAYKAVIKDNVKLNDPAQLEKWLQQNDINIQDYNKASQSQARQALVAYMTDITRYYSIKATPTFIVNKKWLAQQDRDFPAFADQLLSLLQHDKPLE